jgi:two-component system KDP operon response regulator KdpE
VTRVLVVDDDATLVRALGINLRARHYDVVSAASGAGALALAGSRAPDIVILDLGLPDMDGTDVIRGLVGWSSAPIIVLSARDQQRAKVEALDAGATDFITKPFGMDELLARMRAALRRVAGSSSDPVVVTPDFTVLLAAKRVLRRGADVKLTPTEWHLLEVLVRNAGRTVEHQRLLDEVWGPAYRGQLQYLRVYIAGLRRKLEPEPAQPRYLLTASGLGYRFQPPE